MLPMLLFFSVFPAHRTSRRALAQSQAARLVPEIIARRPHDTSAFTEGLIWQGGTLYESSGEYNTSTLRQVDELSGQIIRKISVPASFFAEGIAIVDQRLIQLTWQEHTAFVYDPATFAKIGQFAYDGEGWGLCYDGAQLYMSNGSSTVSVRDPSTFAITRQIPVLLDGAPIDQINELECVGNSLYANVWQTDHILQIDKTSGQVTAVIDASGLLTPDERTLTGPDGVLNGTAYDPQRDLFMITGKLWPWLFEVRFVPANTLF